MGQLFQEDITIFNVYTPNNTESNYVSQKQIELPRKTDEFTIIAGL